MNRISIRVLPR